MIGCRCSDTKEMEGAEAKLYAMEHLQKVRVDLVNWEIEYVCPTTKRRWIMDYPDSSAHGGGPPVLRRINDEPTLA
jgi:Immunity protein 27